MHHPAQLGVLVDIQEPDWSQPCFTDESPLTCVAEVMNIECYPVDTSLGRVWEIRDTETHRPITEVLVEKDARLIVRAVNRLNRLPKSELKP